MKTLKIKNNTEKGYLEAEEGDGINISGRMAQQRGNVQKGMCQTINTMGTDGGVAVYDERSERERVVAFAYENLPRWSVLNLWALMKTTIKHLKRYKVIVLYTTKREIVLEFHYLPY